MKKMNRLFFLMTLSLILLSACKDGEPLTPDHENLTPLPEIPGEEELEPVEDVVTVLEDNYFARYCLARFDADGDGRLTMEEAAAAEAIIPAEDEPALLEDHYRFVSFEGIAYFRNLKRLEIKSSLISTLDLSRNSKLEQLSFDIPQGQARLEQLVVRNTQLRELTLPNCELKELDLRNTPLEVLNLGQGAEALSSLDLRYCPALRLFSCTKSSISSLELRYCPLLEELELCDMPLQQLDLSNGSKLHTLTLNRTRLTALSLKYCTALSRLDLAENSLSQLDLSHQQELLEVDLSDNPLLKIDISKCEKLERFKAERTQISALNTDYNNQLRELKLSGSKLRYLDLSTNPKLECLECASNELVELVINSDNNPLLCRICCAQNRFISLDFSRCAISEWLEEDGSSFAPQPDLEVLTLPTHTLKVSLEQFTTSPKLRKVILQAVELPTLHYEVLEPSAATLYVPAEALESYQASPWSEAFAEIRAL